MSRQVSAFWVFFGIFACGHIGIDLNGRPAGGETNSSGGAPSAGAGGHSGAGGTVGGVGSEGGTAADTGGALATGGSLSSGGAPGAGGSLSSGGAPGAGGGGAGSGAATTTGGSGTGGKECVEDPPAACRGGNDANPALVGWAAEPPGLGTTGGRDGPTVTVRTGTELIAALNNRAPTAPITIIVAGRITAQNSNVPLDTSVEKIDIKDTRNISIIGQGRGQDFVGEFDGIGLKLLRTGNIVLRNLRIHHVAIGEKDAIGIAGPADHIWVDHCELYSDYPDAPKETYDGLIDAKDDVDYLTYSWNYLHDSWSTVLVGATDEDNSERRLTFHHNRVERCYAGGPSYRFGNGHIFNNYYSGIASTAINSRMGACLLVENNAFVDTLNPWVSAYSTEPGEVGLVCNKRDTECDFSFTDPLVSIADACEASVPYDYTAIINAVDAVPTIVQANAGVGILDDPLVF